MALFGGCPSVRVNLAVHRMQLIESRCFLIAVQQPIERSLVRHRPVIWSRGCVQYSQVHPPDRSPPHSIAAVPDGHALGRRIIDVCASVCLTPPSLPENAQKCSRDPIIKLSHGMGLREERRSRLRGGRALALRLPHDAGGSFGVAHLELSPTNAN